MSVESSAFPLVGREEMALKKGVTYLNQGVFRWEGKNKKKEKMAKVYEWWWWGGVGALPSWLKAKSWFQMKIYVNILTNV